MDGGHMAAGGNYAIGRFMAEKTAKMRWCADRAAYIAAKFQRVKPSPAPPPSRPTSCPAYAIIGLAGCAVQVL